ncbi:MAG: sigma-70 family RNA polymerase sigma factor [Lachnospiraceae bacterium]|nr:sigma-70 family RNA polymerase sigma factor [Lachnospiraceae bacterium]
MWQKNNGKSETEILQNQFTAYLATAVQHRRGEYIQQISRQQQTEFVTEVIEDSQKEDVEKDMLSELPLSMQLEDSALIHALKEVNDRERHIFFARVLDERSFESLAEEMGLGYKGVAAIYYRTIQKIKKKMKEMSK